MSRLHGMGVTALRRKNSPLFSVYSTFYSRLLVSKAVVGLSSDALFLETAPDPRVKDSGSVRLFPPPLLVIQMPITSGGSSGPPQLMSNLPTNQRCPGPLPQSGSGIQENCLFTRWPVCYGRVQEGYD